MSPTRPTQRLGVDTGGTFTDLVLEGAEGPRVEKVLSTPEAPENAILEGIERLVPGSGTEVVHGSTVGLNALLTDRGARVALVTNEGFRDLIEIGRQDRPELYALHPVRPAPLAARDDRYEVAGVRAWPADGGMERDGSPSSEQLERLALRIQRSGVESVAVCLLHAYADPGLEAAVAEPLRALGLPVTTSASLLGLHREFERWSTALVNAALVPVMGSYLARLQGRLGDLRLSMLQSSGGAITAELAAAEPARVVLSGPAGGVVGAARAAREADLGPIVTLDMGGTSTDVAFHDPASGLDGSTGRANVAGHPVALPTLDVHTIGCGGGSLITLDSAGVLQVGPESAGAEPGPICFGRGTQPTLTDALCLLGRLGGGRFLGGAMELQRGPVEEAFARLGERLGCSAREAAEAALLVARAAMRRAVSVMTMQRGKDPALLTLVAFGGGGGLLAAELAEDLGTPRVLVPANAGVLSAVGMVHAEASLDHARTVLEPLGAWPARRRASAFRELEDHGRTRLRAAGHAARACSFERVLELRYQGQSHELAVAEQHDPAAAFQALHQTRFGWTPEEGEIELVHLGSRAVVRRPEPEVDRLPRARRAPAAAQLAAVRIEGHSSPVPALDRARLAPGSRIEGPAVVAEATATTWVPPGWTARVVQAGHLLLERS